MAKPMSARVCSTLHEASSQPYFFEGLMTFAQQSIPFGDGYEAWKEAKRMAMTDGREFFFLGAPSS
ncbi:MAG: hypothetical protein JF886_11280 [Candidatus Dormibacteraeota bacterium]|uniref:Uncharacterized protein n=1 Tax=Candidatus Aeolococcus gillhamiae TaxID=3127015 RepID=A0A934JWN0_9BACT|nr:hypothetical protein [Candidatus Dormibacteraeota bacterium]